MYNILTGYLNSSEKLQMIRSKTEYRVVGFWEGVLISEIPKVIDTRIFSVKEHRGIVPDSKVHGANMGPTWVQSAPDGPRVGPWTLISGVVFPHIY